MDIIMPATTEGSLTVPASAPVPAGPTAERKQLGEHTTAPWKIAVLALCPARYYLAGIAKDPRRKESGFEAQVGTLLHHGIEQVAWMRTWVTLGKNEALTPEELLRGIDQPTTNKSIEAARRNPEALAEARVLGKKVAKHVDMAGLLVESVGAQLRPLVEEPWTLDVGEIDGERVVVGGIWDFVRRRKGRIVVTDWKKGGDVRGTDELRLDPAATLYAAAAKARWPKEHVRVEHFYLTRGTSSGIDWTPELDEWARMAALEHARAVRGFGAAGVWPATPSERACSFCNFRSSCAAYRERVTAGMGLGSFDASQLGDLEKAIPARAKAAADVKLAERWIEDIDRVLEPVVARAAEAGQDELVIAGHVVRRGKRSTHSFPLWRRTIQRLWELTGIAPDDAEDAVLALRIGAVEDLLAARGFSPEDRERIVEVLKNETAEERSSTWIEVRPVADPMPTVDVQAILATGTRVALPRPAPVEPKNTTPAAPAAGDQPAQGTSTGPASEAAPAPAPSSTSSTASPATPETRPLEPSPASQGLSPADFASVGADGKVVKVEELTHATAVIANARIEGNPALAAAIVTVEKAEDPKESVGFGARALGFPCECGKSFQNKRGLSGHRRSCPTAKKEAPAS